MDINQEITDRIASSFAEISSDDRSADHSWEHCYRFFSASPTDLNLASLHLAFYLASWGMYRGSAGIREFDYLAHRPVVKLLLHSKYDALRGASLEVLSNRFDDLLWPLIEHLTTSEIYDVSVSMTDTLVTKILLGTVGCTPAYDRYFKGGLSKQGLNTSFSKKGFRALLDYCQEHHQGFMNAPQQKPAYPIMRLADMYFHSVGRGEQ